MMSVLEMRKFEKGEIIANEMEECLEVIFVEQGRYNIGYEVNKKPFYRVRFGESTIIGGFQVTFDKRFNFIYQAHNTMLGQAIRKEHFKKLLKKFANYRNQLKKKFFSHYSQHVYQPLMNRKQRDVFDYNYRSDFKQVLYLKHQDNNLIRECTFLTYLDLRGIEDKILVQK